MRLTIMFAVNLCAAAEAAASVTVYNNTRAAWLAAAGPHTRIGFTGFAPNTIITNQYAHLGVTFTDGSDRTFNNTNLFPNDGVGLNGALNEIELAFAGPMYAIGVDHPGSVKFLLYWQGVLTYTSQDFLFGGAGHFAGLISTQPFDAAIILDPTNDVFIDDLYFGPPVPGPGAFWLVMLSVSAPRRRRKEGR